MIQTSELEILPDLRAGRLVPVLADYPPAGDAAVWALYPSSRHMAPRMRVLLDFLTRWFRDARGGAGAGDTLESRVPAVHERCLPATTGGESRQPA